MKRSRIGVVLAGIALGVIGAALPAGAAPAGPAPAGHAPQAAYSNQTTALPKGPASGTDRTEWFSAQAHLDGVCQIFELCVWSSANFTGAVMRDFFNAESNWNAVAANIANNDESALNQDPSFVAVLCTSPGFVGSCGVLLPSTGGNAAAPFINNSESNTWTF